MTFEDRVIRVQRLMTELEGKNPAEFVNRLMAAGYDRFYVKVPDGFRINLIARDPFPPFYQLNWPRETVPMGTGKAQIQYLQLDRSELRKLIENPPAVLSHVRQGGLEVVPNDNEFIAVSFKYRPGLLGSLLPVDAETADKTPEAFDVRSNVPVVVKTLNRTRSAYSYTLHGIQLHDVYVEELTSAPAPAELPAERVKAGENPEDVPADPYGLKDESPVVYELLCLAYENRGAPENRMKESQLKARFEAIDATYRKNPRPFNNGRDQFAKNLVNPGYKYGKDNPPLKPPIPEPGAIPRDDFLDQDFINEGLKVLLYAACCWSDRMEPCLGRDLMKLVDLLRSFGLRDADEYDPVQRMVYFIAGMSARRRPHLTDYKDERGYKKSRR